MKQQFNSHCLFPVTDEIQDLLDNGRVLDNPFVLDLLGMVCTNYRYFFKTTKPTKNILDPVIKTMKNLYGESLPFTTVNLGYMYIYI